MSIQYYLAIPDLKVLIYVGSSPFVEIDEDIRKETLKQYYEVCEKFNNSKYDVDLDRKYFNLSIKDLSSLIEYKKDTEDIFMDLKFENTVLIEAILKRFKDAKLVSDMDLDDLEDMGWKRVDVI